MLSSCIELERVGMVAVGRRGRSERDTKMGNRGRLCVVIIALRFVSYRITERIRRSSRERKGSERADLTTEITAKTKNSEFRTCSSIPYFVVKTMLRALLRVLLSLMALIITGLLTYSSIQVTLCSSALSQFALSPP